MKNPGQPAYVLHHWDWSETSLILDLFTREQGRVAAVAKGAKRPYSQLRAVLLPFQRIQVLLGKPKADEASDILTLRSAEYGGSAAALPASQLFSGFYLNELLMKLLARQDTHALLFDAYADSLQALAIATDEAPLRAFELMLLRETGVLPELSCATLTQTAVHADQRYVLRPEAGLAAANANEPALSGSDCLALQAALDANAMQPLREACSVVLPALRQQLRSLLHYHLGSPQLRTRAAMLEVRRLLDSPPTPGPR